MASISSPLCTKPLRSNGRSIDEVDNSNLNSILVATDDLGYMHCFLDGNFPLGATLIGADLSTSSLFKSPRRPVFFAHLCQILSGITLTGLHPTMVTIPLLGERRTRDFAMLSSTARELTWYAMRVVREMHTIWFGYENFSGARELGPRWIQALEIKQKDQFGRKPVAFNQDELARLKMF